jgi:hypothetical protein
LKNCFKVGYKTVTFSVKLGLSGVLIKKSFLNKSAVMGNNM